jgi:large subunit ribosomal protein L4
MQITVYNTKGTKQTSWSFDVKQLGKLNTPLLAQALRIYESNSHQGGSRVKTRGEVTGSTRKIYRQKGTGRARHGARYAPIFVGGGVAHGPTAVRAANLKLPKKMRRHALRSALLTKLSSSALFGLTAENKAAGKTNSLTTLLGKSLGHPKSKVLVVTDTPAPGLLRALSNLQRVSLKPAALVNAYDLIYADSVLLTKGALNALVARATNQLPEPKVTKK